MDIILKLFLKMYSFISIFYQFYYFLQINEALFLNLCVCVWVCVIMLSVKKVELVREAGRWRRYKHADMADTTPLRGPGAEGPLAVIYNRTRLLATTGVPSGIWW